ncbi:MAG TPA: phosphodiester glycosidase family protein [Paludibacteraceae bacterium]|nr:phosphodiester glycosidase family protein [Paludibacteraceae bacterium]
MKKIIIGFILVLAIFLQTLQAQNTITLNNRIYRIDTLVQKHKIGPGAYHTYYDLPTYPLKVHIVEIDLTNPHIQIETCLANDKALTIERPSSMARRKDYPGHDVVAATNGGFYFYTDPVDIGIPRSAQFINEECMVAQPYGRASFILGKNKKPFVDRFSFNGLIKTGTNSHKLNMINTVNQEVYTEENANIMILYTDKFGGKTPTDNTGIEILIKPKEGTTFTYRSNQDYPAVVEKILPSGGNSVIPTGKAVLFGRGNSRDFLTNINEGDEITISLEFELRTTPNLLKEIKESIGGSDHKILNNGQLGEGDYGAYYGSHPRTGMGISKDSSTVYLIEVDGRQPGFSMGVSLYEFAEIFKSAGAWNAVNLDGGGSSIMIVNKEIVSKFSESTERAVGNGVLIVSQAPVDNVISHIEFEPKKLEIPMYSELCPKIYGYNQYGLLINKDVKGFQLSCSPELGQIINDSIFVASNIKQTGVLTATFNNLSVAKMVTIVDANINIRLDSVLIDHRTQYPIEVLSQNNKTIMNIPPAALSWNIRDPEICSINENGILKCLKNGSTMVIGTLGDFKDSLKVIVEIPTSGRMIGDNFNVENWTLNASASLNAVLNTENLPSNWTHGAAVNYVYTSTRAPFIKLLRNVPMYGLPDTLKLIINIGDINISKALLSLRANNATVSASKEFTNIPKNRDTELSVAMSELFDATDIAIYPVWFDNINFYLGTQTTGQAYTLALKEIVLCYKDVEISGLPSVLLSQYEVYPNPLDGTILNIRIKDSDSKLLQAQLFHLNGQSVVSQQLNPVSGMATFKIGKLPAGTYLLKLYSNNETETIKVIIK